MNTKNKIIAILMASIVAMAVAVPMAMGEIGGTSATVGNVDPTVEAKCENPNPVTPDAEGPVTVMKCAIVGDANGKDTITSVTAVTKYPDTSVKDTETMHVANASERTACSCLGTLPDVDDPVKEVYVGYFDILPCDPKGNYVVTVTVEDDQTPTPGTDSKTNTLVVNALVAVNIADMAYGTVAPLSDDNTGKHVATNIGNVKINFSSITPSDMTDNGNTIPASGITCINPGVQINPSAPPACAGTSADVNFQLDVPAVPTGIYTGQTTFTPQEVLP